MATAKLEIRHNTDLQRFEATVDGELARADYKMDGNVMRMVHTEVPPGFEGRGIAAALVSAALAYARAAGLTVLPRCSYVRAYMRRHPETHSLLAAESTT